MVIAPQTAQDRELLLVPVPAPGTPDDAAAVGGQVAGEQGTVSSTAPTANGALLVTRTACIVLATLTIGVIVQVVWLSRLEQRSAQQSLFNQFRKELALGTAPIGPTTADGKHLLALGTPMALLSIPSIRVHQIVAEGTTGAVLAKGPGHLRDTVFPGGPGTSVIFARASAYGGPFGMIADLHKGALITVTTGVGVSHFRVVDIRHAGAKVHLPKAGTARLTLGTASGPPFVPSGVVLVDADMVGASLAADPPAVSTVPPSEQPLGSDTSTIWALFLWLEVLAASLAGAVWTWRRRGPVQAWLIFSAPLLLVWILTVNQATRLLPNLL